MRTVLVLAAVAFSALTFACSHDADAEKEGSVAAASSAVGDGFCTTYCKKSNECDSDLDQQTCEKKCEDAFTPLRTLRSDIVESAQKCFASSDCKKVLAGDRLADCVDEAELDVTPSTAAKELCDALEKSTDRCSSDSAVDHVKCLGAMKSYGDAALADAKTCADKACDAIWDCVDATL